MKLALVKPRKALNKAFLKVKPNRSEIENFKANLIKLIDRIDKNESEEFHKNLVADFLKETYYKENHFINTKGRTDLVIHNGKDAKTSVGVIIETKKPDNKYEMLKKDNVNVKAFHELMLYYLRERISLKNLEIKYLVATNIYEWFIFDANTFEKEFAQNKNLVKQFTDFEEGRLSGKTTDIFYNDIAKPFIDNIKNEIEFAYFDIREYEKPLRNNDKKDDNLLIALFKLISPEHLLKLPFINDSNTLDRGFYTEMLHLIGLSETKEGSKKVIGRKAEKERNPGSLIENTITILQYEDCLGQIKALNYGETKDEQLYNVALELTITWINRILFLKLMEGQLIKYHKGDSSYKFLNIEQIPDYDALNKLFFQVLAVKENERNDLIKRKFGKIPYLNSSLFEPNELEHKTIRISNLEDEYKLPILNSTVLKDKNGKRIKGEMNTLEYLFKFLDAYDFAGEGSEDIQEENKTLINASVLGLIFEKINGYKDGSFFTPGFITMYMARETIRRAVVQKFNEFILTPGSSSHPLSSMERGKGGEEILPTVETQSPPELLKHARELRKNKTEAEEILWQLLKNRKLNNWKFRRQHPIKEGFILDFYCAETRVAIELDGNYHNETTQKEYDKERTLELDKYNIKVIRFWNREVLDNIEEVLKKIVKFSNINKPNKDKQKNISTNNERYKSLEDIYNAIGDEITKNEANQIINSLRICDPAVGSGHFLVSALNEIIAIKSELQILMDKEGKVLRYYHIEVVNDELIITDEDGHFFEYNPKNHESRRIQETLFHEKETIIENCLFGVDINPNSVKICRLRLWIELLKNAYYKKVEQLETLPNIDINIKCGNSLISRYALDADVKQALKKSKWTIDSYRLAVMTYRNARSKEEKQAMVKLIEEIKNDFETEIAANDKRLLKLNKLKGDLFALTNQQQIFEQTKTEKAAWDKKINKLTNEIQKLETELEEIKTNKIYENAIEWRFEFPEILNDEGDFVGFDIVIGNPPYINFRDIKLKDEKNWFLNKYSVSEYQSDLFILFIELSYGLLKNKGEFGFIIPNSITNNLNNSKIREFILNNSSIKSIINTPIGVFPDATVDTIVLVSQLPKIYNSNLVAFDTQLDNIIEISIINQIEFEKNEGFYFDFLTPLANKKILKKIESDCLLLDSITNSSSGIKEYETTKGIPSQTDEDRINKVFNSKSKISNKYRKHITGSEVNKYVITWNGDYLKYGEWLAAPRNPIYFEGERIIIREIPSKTSLIAAFTDENFTVKNTAHVFIPDERFNVKYLVGLINSKLMGFYFINKFSERDDVFPKAKIGQCRLLPIKVANSKIQKSIEKQVIKIISAKKKNLNIDTSNYENEIDQLVYQLYGLTGEEIKIVEESIK